MANVEDKILRALTEDKSSSREDVVFKDIPYEDKKQFICRNINSLSVPDRKDIGQILILNNKKKWIKDCSEGCIIHLDNMDDSVVITQMYNLMLYKLSKKTSTS